MSSSTFRYERFHQIEDVKKSVNGGAKIKVKGVLQIVARINDKRRTVKLF